MQKGIFIENGDADQFVTEYVAYADREKFLTTYTVTAQFNDLTSETIEEGTSLVGRTITGATVTVLAPTIGTTYLKLCSVESGEEGAKTLVTDNDSDALTLTVTSPTTITVSGYTSNVRVQAKYVDASGVDIEDDHLQDKLGIDAHATLTVN